MIEVRKPTTGDLRRVLPDVRQADMEEWYAGTGQLFHFSALQAILSKGFRKVALEDGLPLCFWGADAVPGEDRKGVVWMFATNHAKVRWLRLNKVLRPNLEDLHEEFGELSAYADCRNVVHHKWLLWLGFERREVVRFGPLNMPFQLFHRGDPKCA